MKKQFNQFLNRCILYITMKQFLCLFSIFFSLSSSSQTTYYFNKLYDNDSLWDRANSVQETDSGYWIEGQTDDFLSPNYVKSLLLINIDERGIEKDRKIYGKANQNLTDFSASFRKINGNGFATAGWTLDSTGWDMLMVKYKDSGDTSWLKVYKDTMTDENIYSCRQTKDGGFILVGITQIIKPTTQNIQLLLVKTDSTGNIKWKKTFGSGGNDYGFSIEQTKDDGFIIGGYYDVNGVSGKMWIIKTDDTGKFVWDKKIGSGTVGTNVFQSKDGNYIFYSAKDNLDGNGYQGYIAKLDSIGINILWEKTYGGQKVDDFGRVLELSDSSLIAVGNSESNPQNNPFGWLVKMNSKGDSIWARYYYIRNDGFNYILDADITKDGGFILGGRALPLQSNIEDAWVIKTDSNGNTCSFAGCDSVATGFADMQMSKLADVQIYPNPFSHSAYLRITNLYEFTNGKLQLSIYNLLGEKVKQSTINNQQSTISRDGLPNGIYFYQIKNKEGMLASGKFVISD